MKKINSPLMNKNNFKKFKKWFRANEWDINFYDIKDCKEYANIIDKIDSVKKKHRNPTLKLFKAIEQLFINEMFIEALENNEVEKFNKKFGIKGDKIKKQLNV